MSQIKHWNDLKMEMSQIKYWDYLTPKQKVTRWSHAVRVMENMTKYEIEKHFNMNSWGEKTPCGTICCAAGFCGLDPVLRKMGFELNFRKVRKGVHAYFSIQPYYFFGIEAYDTIFTDPRIC
jgi:hypothetical protein